jgi:hypothetical protein
METAPAGDQELINDHPTPRSSSHDAPAGTESARRAWLWLLTAAVTVGLLAMVANMTTTAQLSGEDPVIAALRKTVSKLASAGVVWAGVAVLGGWLVRPTWLGMLAGTTGLLTALVAHYGAADLTGLMSSATWSNNREWFLAALVLGPPLGLIGGLARRVDLWGLLARLVVPAGALIEPIFLGWLSPMPRDIWSNRLSGVLAGCLMVGAGVALTCLVVLRWLANRRIGSRPVHTG